MTRSAAIPTLRLAGAALLAGALLAAPAQALEYRDGSVPESVLSALQRDTIRDWFGTMPTGQRPYPAGINDRAIYVGAPLPAGLAAADLPAGLLEELPEKEGFVYGQVGGDVVLIESATQRVRDVMRDVVE